MVEPRPPQLAGCWERGMHEWFIRWLNTCSLNILCGSSRRQSGQESLPSCSAQPRGHTGGHSSTCVGWQLVPRALQTDGVVGAGGGMRGAEALFIAHSFIPSLLVHLTDPTPSSPGLREGGGGEGRFPPSKWEARPCVCSWGQGRCPGAQPARPCRWTGHVCSVWEGAGAGARVPLPAPGVTVLGQCSALRGQRPWGPQDHPHIK